MNINFATSERATALQYMQRAEPSKNYTEESAGPILDLVENNIMRIGDPFMYGGKAPLFPSDGFNESMRSEVMSAIKSINY